MKDIKEQRKFNDLGEIDAMDLAREAAKGKEKIGTTGRGIGPCYEDKAGRTGIRGVDLFESETLGEKIKANLKEKNFFLTKYLNAGALEFQPIYDAYLSMAEVLRPYIITYPWRSIKP